MGSIDELYRRAWSFWHRNDLVQSVRSAVRDADPALTAMAIQPMNTVVWGTVAQPRFRTELLCAFAVIALMLAAIGIYGLIAYGVNQRTQEIGVRLALGATRLKVMSLVLVQALRLCGIGVALGIPAALLGARRMDRELPQDRPVRQPIPFSVGQCARRDCTVQPSKPRRWINGPALCQVLRGSHPRRSGLVGTNRELLARFGQKQIRDQRHRLAIGMAVENIGIDHSVDKHDARRIEPRTWSSPIVALVDGDIRRHSEVIRG